MIGLIDRKTNTTYLALLIEHCDRCDVVSRLKSGFRVVLFQDWAVDVGPGVHRAIGVTVIVEVLTLKAQSQSPGARHK